VVPVKTSRRIKSASTYEVQAPNRPAAIGDFSSALDQVCIEHPEIRNHSITVSDGELAITLEIEAENWSSADETVRDVIERAVARINGRIVADPEPFSLPVTSATFEQLGTYLVPA